MSVIFVPPTTLISTPVASEISTSSNGEFNASSIASVARSSESSSDSPRPIRATPAPFMIVLISLKSRFTSPGLVIISVIPFIALIKSSSATLKARFIERFGQTFRSLSLGMTITVSADSLKRSRPQMAFSILIRPSPSNGIVVTAIVSAPIVLASFATYGADPVPVPPPIPAVTNTMWASIRLLLSSSSASAAASSPTLGKAPAPSPLVHLRPKRILLGAFIAKRCCASVFAAYNSAPVIPSSTIRPIVLVPPPPHPTILIFVLSWSKNFDSSSSMAEVCGCV